MRSLKSGLVAIAISGIFGTAAVVGCSADGGGADLAEDTDPTLGAEAGSGSVVPPRDDTPQTPVDAGKDSGPKKDAGPKQEAGVDAGPPPPVPGTACTTPNEIAKKSCGKCGTASALCLDQSGNKTWSDYGACTGELPTGCLPGTTQPCGNCGTQTCTQFCGWGACTGQPANSCTPGGVELTGAGCPADTYRQRTCKADCSYTSFSLTCEAPPTYLDIAGTVGSTNAALITLKPAQTITRISGTCPTATLATGTNAVTPYSFFEIRNPTTKTATVSIFHSQAPGGGVLDTVIAVYAGATAPADDNARKACLKGVNDFGSVALTGDGNFGSLTGSGTSGAVTIAPGASVTVYSAQYYTYDAADSEKAAGNLKLNVKTETLE